MLARRRVAPLLLALTALSSAAFADDWIKLQAPSFGVVSQLSAEETRKWAVEFDQFIGGMHNLYQVEELDLPPLTIVLFRQNRAFTPYRMQTESGRANVAGFFAHVGDWSVIGLSGAGRDTTTRSVIYHEAVHWFTSAAPTEPPLWFSEGLAEVLSTFRVVDGKGRWGEGIEDNINYLATFGLMPLEELLRASQDEALHGSASTRYYPQSWLFVHYLMFGNGGRQRAKLGELLTQQLSTDLDTAFEAAFGTSYEAVNLELRRYMNGGRYSYEVTQLRDRSDEMTVEPASEVNVEFALGRLALAGGNDALASRHADRVIELAPRAPQGYELKAYASYRTEDPATANAMLERALELGSRDALLYAAKAERLLTDNIVEGEFLDRLLRPEVAREIADLYLRSLASWVRNPSGLQGLAVALLNSDTITDVDEAALNAGRRMYPTNGILLVGQAAVAKNRGQITEAIRLLQEAASQPNTLGGIRPQVTALRTSWTGEWIASELAALTDAGRFDDARAFVAERLADEFLTRPIRTMLERMERLLQERDAGTR